MGYEQGSQGTIEIFDDFFAFDTSSVGTVASPIGTGGWNYCSVNEGSIDNTVDEPGGIKAITNDTADADNFFFFTGPFKPADGGAYMETRLKMTTITGAACFVGFSETLNAATPVMPAEISTSTVTYNGSGGMVGLAYDVDMATADWMAVCGDGGAVNVTAVDGNEAPVSDEWDVIRVEIGPSGRVTSYLNGRVVMDANSTLTVTSDLFYACMGVENRLNGIPQVFEVDYGWAKGGRDWQAT